jgi:hypothetical protein
MLCFNGKMNNVKLAGNKKGRPEATFLKKRTKFILENISQTKLTLPA